MAPTQPLSLRARRRCLLSLGCSITDHRLLVEGYESADSCATDAHKTLNVLYDSGLCIVRDAAALPRPGRGRRPGRATVPARAAFADALRTLPGVTVLDDVVFTQVCATFGSDERTDEVVQQLLAGGTTWMTGSIWHGQRVLRISVSTWSTTETDVERCMEAVRRVALAG